MGARCAVVHGINMLQGRMLVVLYGSCSGCPGWVLLTVQLLRLSLPRFCIHQHVHIGWGSRGCGVEGDE